jgi:hypothetical protein
MAEHNHRGYGDHGGRHRDDTGSSLNIEDRHDNLQPMQQRLRMRNQAQDEAYARSLAGNAPATPHAPPPAAAGSFIQAEDPSWIAQLALVQDAGKGLAFNPSRHFDGIIAAKSGIRGLYDPSGSDYAHYEGLRTNLAALRNTLLASGMDQARMESMATALGQAFANDTWIRRDLMNSINSEAVNVEGVGAGEMYKYLLSIQHPPSPVPALRGFVNWLVSEPDRTWNLPPLELTPFSESNMEAVPLSVTVPPETFTAPAAKRQSFAERYKNSEPPQFSKA